MAVWQTLEDWGKIQEMQTKLQVTENTEKTENIDAGPQIKFSLQIITIICKKLITTVSGGKKKVIRIFLRRAKEISTAGYKTKNGDKIKTY